MEGWLAAIPALLVSGVILLGPGGMTGWLLGLRGVWLWSIAPIISVGAIAGASILLPWLHLEWTPWTAVGGAMVLCLILAALVRWILRTRFRAHPTDDEASTTPRIHWGWTASSLLLSAAVLTTATLIGIRSASDISQTLDNLFHLGVTRFILDTGNASPFWISTFANPESATSFYPDVWHAAVSLVAELSGSTIPIAFNGFNLAVMVLAWPVGVVLLTRQFLPVSPAATIAAGALAASFPAFPLNTLTYGVLYPYFLGLALLPASLALLMQTVRLTRDVRIGRLDAIVVLLVLSVGALGLTHPSAFMGLLALSAPIVLIAFLARWRNASWRQRIVRLVLLLSYLLAGVLILRRVRTSFQWPPQTDTATAVGHVLSGSFLGAGAPLIVGALALAGVVVALVRRDALGITAAALWITAGVLYVSAAGSDIPMLRRLVAAWFADTPRLGALAVVAVIPIAVYGFDWMCRQLLRIPVASKTITVVAAAAALVAILTTSGYPGFLQQMRLSYDGQSDEYIDSIPPEERSLLGNLAPDGQRVGLNSVLSDDERALLTRLPQHVGADDVIAGNPWTGTTLSYALAGRESLIPYLTTPLDPASRVIMEEFALRPDSPEVCAALEEKNVRFILDFGSREVHSGEHEYPGIEDAEQSGAVELVDQEGDARLFRVISCGLAA